MQGGIGSGEIGDKGAVEADQPGAIVEVGKSQPVL
jgi:hypothetical protein